jgi:capsular polysaccharide biosynthesis protein/GGDEF domain-containing protein
MEAKMYLRMLVRRWWLILAALFFTVVPTVILVTRQPWVYEASTSYVIRPRAQFNVPEDEIVDAVGTLSRQPEISTTFAEVADSRLIRQRAIEQLGLSGQERKGLRVNGSVVAGTNVVEINVEGPDPGIVRDLADAAGVETANYVNSLYDVFELEPLDSANFPNRPAGPNRLLTIALGAGFGLLLGIGLVFLVEYLQEPAPEELSFNIVDGETGVYNEPYFRLRLGEEISRAMHGDQTFALALIKPDHSGQLSAAKASSQLKLAIGTKTRSEDILAHLGSATFALLMPGMSGDAVRELLEGLQFKAPRVGSGSDGVATVSSVGITSYKHGEATVDEILALAADALVEATRNPARRIVLSARNNGNAASHVKKVEIGAEPPVKRQE